MRHLALTVSILCRVDQKPLKLRLKLARQYFVETGSPQRSHIIARKQSYHGNTLGALAAGGNAWRREQFAPLLFTASHIEPCYRYRGKADGESDHAYGQRMANALETEILRLGADKVMAFLAEPVVGATLGAVAAECGIFHPYSRNLRSLWRAADS